MTGAINKEKEPTSDSNVVNRPNLSTGRKIIGAIEQERERMKDRANRARMRELRRSEYRGESVHQNIEAERERSERRTEFLSFWARRKLAIGYLQRNIERVSSAVGEIRALDDKTFNPVVFGNTREGLNQEMFTDSIELIESPKTLNRLTGNQVSWNKLRLNTRIDVTQRYGRLKREHLIPKEEKNLMSQE